MEFEKPIYAYEMGGKKSSPPPAAAPVVEAEPEEEENTSDKSGVETEGANTIAGIIEEQALTTSLLDEEDEDGLTTV